MRHRSALLLAALCGVAAAQVQPEGVSVTVVLDAEHLPPVTVLSSMERQAGEVMGEAQATLQWYLRSQGDHPPTAQRVALIRLIGECSPGVHLPIAPQRRGRSGEPLGRTHVVDGNVLPIAEVRCDAIRRLVGRDLQTASIAGQEELMGRAMGRVLAHELYHILLRTTSHGVRGLSRPAQTSADLLSPLRRFTPVEAKRIAASGASYGQEDLRASER